MHTIVIDPVVPLARQFAWRWQMFKAVLLRDHRAGRALVAATFPPGFTMLIILGLSTLLTAACVWLHYAGLVGFRRRAASLRWPAGAKLVFGLVVCFVMHVVEVTLFGVVYCTMARFESIFGRVDGEIGHALRDYVYFSFTTYSTVGYGDLVPVGDLRIMAGIESLLGLVLVAWTASFLFLEMLEARSKELDQ